MFVRGVAPSGVLRPFIERYWALSGNAGGGATVELMPDGGIQLIINRGERLLSRDHGAIGRGVYLVGAMLQADEQVLRGQQHLFGITFRPGGFTHLNSYAALGEVAGTVVPFDEALPADARTFDDFAARLDRFYTERLRTPPGAITAIVAEIEARRGRVRIDALARRHAITTRQLERRFDEQIGISPKQFVDLIRFRHAQASIERAAGTRSLADLALECGYCDQAHLNRHFVRFARRSPTRLALSDLSKSARG